MDKKIKAIFNSKESNINLKLDGCIPIGIMSEEQYNRYKKSEIASFETTSMVLKNEDKNIENIITFLHPITKAKFILAYDKEEEVLFLIPDISLNVDMGMRNININGYQIGSANIESKIENFNFKKSIDTSFKIKLDATKFGTLRNNIKIVTLAIPGANYGSSSGRSFGHYSENGDYTEYNTYLQSVIKIKFTDEILNASLPVNILTTCNIQDDKIISNNNVLVENINNNIVFLSL